MDALDSRKFSLLRKARKTHWSADINLDGLLVPQPRRAISDIHFLPMPDRLSQLLPQEQAVPELRGTADATSSAELEAFRKEIDTEISLRKAEMLAMRRRVLVMENDLVLIRKSMLRVKTFAIASSFFVIVWAISVSLFL